MEESFYKTPTPLEIPIKLHTFKFFGLTEPPTPMKFQYPLWEEYGYFLELFNGSTLLEITFYSFSSCRFYSSSQLA